MSNDYRTTFKESDRQSIAITTQLGTNEGSVLLKHKDKSKRSSLLSPKEIVKELVEAEDEPIAMTGLNSRDGLLSSQRTFAKTIDNSNTSQNEMASID